MKRTVTAILLATLLGAVSKAAVVSQATKGSPELDAAMHLAVDESDDLNAVLNLLDRGASIDAPGDPGGETILMKYAGEGRGDAVQALLKRGAKVDARDNAGMTALIKAVYNNRPAVISILLEGGADVNAKAYDGTTALMASGGNFETAPLLRAKGANSSAAIRDETPTQPTPNQSAKKQPPLAKGPKVRKYELLDPYGSLHLVRENGFILNYKPALDRDPETGDTTQHIRIRCANVNAMTKDCTCPPGKKQFFESEKPSRATQSITRLFKCCDQKEEAATCEGGMVVELRPGN